MTFNLRIIKNENNVEMFYNLTFSELLDKIVVCDYRYVIKVNEKGYQDIIIVDSVDFTQFIEEFGGVE